MTRSLKGKAGGLFSIGRCGLRELKRREKRKKKSDKTLADHALNIVLCLITAYAKFHVI